MRRMLSLIKRHIVRGTWARPAKERRPLSGVTLAPGAKPRPKSRPLIPACDVDLIVRNYAGRPIDARPDSPTLPASLRPGPQPLRSPLKEYAFIDFEPVYTVAVVEVAGTPQLALRKPKTARYASFYGVFHGRL